MLVINLATSHFCSGSRMRKWKIITIHTVFTALILSLALLIRKLFNLEYLNVWLIIALGSLYYFPIKYAYKESPVKTLSIMTFSWIHTLSVTGVCLNIATILTVDSPFLTALIIQSAVFIVTTPLIIKFIKKWFRYILENIPENFARYLFLLGLLLLSILVLIQQFGEDGLGQYLKIAAIVIVVLTANVSYLLIYHIVKNSKSIKVLRSLAYSDSLTGLKNRLALFLDCDELISQKKPFSIIYMDLDNFKLVNDTYGHSTGDEYLQNFTEAAISTVGDAGCVYRMSGDEFVCLCEKCETEDFFDSFNENISDFINMDIPFLGVSMGKAKYPVDAGTTDELLKKADRIMYHVKKNR